MMTWREFQRLQRVADVGDTFISSLDDGDGSARHFAMADRPRAVAERLRAFVVT